jgi:hypothetical protein
MLGCEPELEFPVVGCVLAVLTEPVPEGDVPKPEPAAVEHGMHVVRIR